MDVGLVFQPMNYPALIAAWKSLENLQLSIVSVAYYADCEVLKSNTGI